MCRAAGNRRTARTDALTSCCTQPFGYYDEDVIGFGEAMRNAGITVSYSPGISVTPANGTFIARNGYAISYRVSEDMCAGLPRACLCMLQR